MNDEVRAILQRYGFMDEGGAIQTADITNGQNVAILRGKTGRKPLITPELLAGMLESVPDSEWFDWLLYQLCGGEEAQRRGTANKERKITFIIHVLMNKGVPDDKVEPLGDQKKAQAYYDKYYAEDVDRLYTLADADILEHLHGGVFGIWPWLDDYKMSSRQMANEEATQTMADFMGLMEHLADYNANVTEAEQIGERPEGEHDLNWLKASVESVEFFVATRSAVKDVANLDVWYTDENVDVVVPYSYATAVMYGFDKWAFANQGIFHKAMRTKADQFSAWKDVFRENHLLVFLQVKKPMPAWSENVPVGEEEHTQEIRSLANLAMLVPAKQKFDPDSLDIYDEGASKKVRWKWSQIVKAVQGEPKRTKPLKPPEYRQAGGTPRYGYSGYEREVKGEVERYVGEPAVAYSDEPGWEKAQADYAKKMAEYEKKKAEWEQSQQGKAPQAPRQPPKSAQQQADAIANSLNQAMKSIQAKAAKADPSRLIREPGRRAE